MGIYRLFLAAMVAISHTGCTFYGYDTGVIAVISFFILSGYVMTLLIEKHYRQPVAIAAFYADRAARLFPQFWFYMAQVTLLICFFNINSPFISKLTFAKGLLNLLILPQGYFMFWDNRALAIPQTWSLGLEMTFYLCYPWLLIYGAKKHLYWLAGLSFLVFLAAYLGKINSDYYGYRLLPGTFFMFLLGWSMYTNDNFAKLFRLGLFLSAGALLYATHFNAKLYQLPFNKEVLTGLLIGVVVIDGIKHLKFSRIDAFLGNLSYGVFLNNYMIVWTMQKVFKIKIFTGINIALFLLVSCMLALASFFIIERPTLKWRQALRIKHQQTPP